MRRSVAAIVLALVCLLAVRAIPGMAADSPSAGSPANGQLLDRIVAVVNDGVVLQSQLDQQLKQVRAQLRSQDLPLPSERALRKQVLDRLVLQTIEDQRAKQAGIRVSGEQVNDALENIAKRQNIPFGQLPDALAAQGVNYAQFREQLRNEIARQMLVQKQVLDTIQITPRELDAYLAQERYAPTASNEFKISHILIAVPEQPTSAQINEARTLAQKIVARARSGQNFAKLAITFSASQNALQGGSLGWLKGTALPTFLAPVISRMKPGQISGPIQTSTGFHIVRLDAVRSLGGAHMVEQVHLRHILLEPNAVEDDATVRQRLVQLRREILSGKDSFAVIARTNSQDAGSAVNGGDLGWAQLSTFVPEFAAQVEKLKVGQISQPFHTRFGWHIVQLLGRRQVDDAKTEARDRAFQALRASRAEESVELWQQAIRKGSYVRIRPSLALAAGGNS